MSSPHLGRHSASGDRPPAIVINGSSNALSAARALAQRSIPVHAIGWRRSPVRCSRAISGFTDVGNGLDWQQRSLDWLARHRSGAVLLPCSDDALELIIEHWTLLQDWGYRLPEIDPGLGRQLLDKELTYELARRMGVAAPRTVVPTEALDADALLEDLGSPCAIKPRRSEQNKGAGQSVGKAMVVSSAAELARGWQFAHETAGPVVVTEIVPGPDTLLSSYWTYVDAGGTAVLEMTKHKLRQHPVGFGTGCHAVTGWDEEIADIGRRFVRGIGLVGFAATEFKRRADTGEPILIESNYRLVDANEQARAAGLDVAWVIYQRALGRTVATQPRARDGVRYWYPVRDFRAFRSERRTGGMSLYSWLRSVARPSQTPYFSPTDPGPSLMVATQTVLHTVGSTALKAASSVRALA